MKSRKSLMSSVMVLALLSVFMAVPSRAEDEAPQSKTAPEQPSMEDQLRAALGQCRANLDFIRKEATAEAANKSGLATKIDQALAQPMPGEGPAPQPPSKKRKQ